MHLQKLFSKSEDSFPLPRKWKYVYGPFGFPRAPKNRPYVSSNFVVGLDGRASFRELPGRAGGKEVSRSKADKWILNFLMAHHDAVLIGADTLRGEAGPDKLGWDLHIEPREIEGYRRNTLGFKKQVVIIVSGSGKLDLDFRIFNSKKVETWIVTSPFGEELLMPQLTKRKEQKPRVIVVGNSPKIDLGNMLQVLYCQHGVGTLHCLGGPNLHGQIVEERLLDESFLTISTQILGKSTDPGVERPTAFGNASFLPENAPWFKTISAHYEPPYHIFMRLRYSGPRQFKN